MSGHSHPATTHNPTRLPRGPCNWGGRFALLLPGDASWQFSCIGDACMVNLPVAELIRRYAAGETTPQLAATYGVAKSTISLRLKAAGVRLRGHGGNCRDPRGPLCTDRDGYLKSTGRNGQACAIQRACWEACHGPIPSGRIIHHIDGDRLNNDIANLECLTRPAHIALHGRKPNGQFNDAH